MLGSVSDEIAEIYKTNFAPGSRGLRVLIRVQARVRGYLVRKTKKVKPKKNLRQYDP